MNHLKNSLLLIPIFLSLFSCKSNDTKQEARSYPVKVADVIMRDTPIYIESIGHVFSLQNVDIRPQVTGILIAAHMDPGQKVKKGDLLFTIDPRPYQAALDQAKATLTKDEATLKLSEITVKRYATLVEKDYVSKLNFDQYSTNVDLGNAQILIDKALVDAAQINLDYCTIYSPMDGRAGDVVVDPGNLIVPNNPVALTTLRQITPADIHFSISQKDFFTLQHAKKDHPLTFEAILPQESGNPRKGEIYFIDNTINMSNGTILLRGTLPNEDELFWPGEFIRVRLEVNMMKDALLVPAEAVKIGQNGHYVYLYKKESGVVEYREVLAGERVNDLVIINKGLTKNDTVVTQGQINLRDGSKVFITPTDDHQKGAR